MHRPRSRASRGKIDDVSVWQTFSRRIRGGELVVVVWWVSRSRLDRWVLSSGVGDKEKCHYTVRTVSFHPSQPPPPPKVRSQCAITTHADIFIQRRQSCTLHLALFLSTSRTSGTWSDVPPYFHIIIIFVSRGWQSYNIVGITDK